MRTCPDPIAFFEEWFREAKSKRDACLDMMTLATVTARGVPSARVVLLKEINQGQFYFFTNYNSNKAADLKKKPQACLVFHWPSLQKQVRITGAVTKTTRKESEEYFRTRPRGSQIGAWASNQSHVISSREVLEKRFSDFEKKFSGKDVPCPKNWGGFRVDPKEIEFWIGQESRLHDRFLYVKKNKKWIISRLAP